VAERIKALAKERRISLQTALVASGAQSHLLTDMVQRGSLPTIDSFILIADYFDVTLDYLLGRPVKMPECSGTLQGMEEAMMKSGVMYKPLNKAFKHLFGEFLAQLASCFMKIVDEHKPPKVEETESVAVFAKRRKYYDLTDKKTQAIEIADRIKALAEAKGVSLSRALVEAGSHISFVKNMTTYASIPQVDAFFPIADYFGVSMDYLLGRPASCSDCPELLADFEMAMKRIGVTDKSIKPEDRALYFELLERQTAAFLRLKDELANTNALEADH
jgi:transcriptional regulator with XRE-family HTH domain